MELKQYQQECGKFAAYPQGMEILYPMIGLSNEAGEALGKLKKILRGDKTLDQQREAIADELGDVLWYMVMSAFALGYTLEDIASINFEKLSRRQAAGTIKGDGDNR